MLEILATRLQIAVLIALNKSIQEGGRYSSVLLTAHLRLARFLFYFGVVLKGQMIVRIKRFAVLQFSQKREKKPRIYWESKLATRMRLLRQEIIRIIRMKDKWGLDLSDISVSDYELAMEETAILLIRKDELNTIYQTRKKVVAKKTRPLTPSPSPKGEGSALPSPSIIFSPQNTKIIINSSKVELPKTLEELAHSPEALENARYGYISSMKNYEFCKLNSGHWLCGRTQWDKEAEMHLKTFQELDKPWQQKIYENRPYQYRARNLTYSKSVYNFLPADDFQTQIEAPILDLPLMLFDIAENVLLTIGGCKITNCNLREIIDLEGLEYQVSIEQENLKLNKYLRVKFQWNERKKWQIYLKLKEVAKNRKKSCNPVTDKLHSYIYLLRCTTKSASSSRHLRY
jgi:hypothetical protein